MTRPRPRRKRRSGLAWTDLRHADEVAFCAASIWLESDPESPIAESGRADVAEDAGRPSESHTAGNPLECWGHSGPARPDMASRVLVEHFGSLGEARRVWSTLSESTRGERPELRDWMEGTDDGG